jgi:hypothetical protein
MEIHQLRYFVAVAEEGSFSNAAEREHVSQPSLSQQIHKLEEEPPPSQRYGAPGNQQLFDRLPSSLNFRPIRFRQARSRDSRHPWRNPCLRSARLLATQNNIECLKHSTFAYAGHRGWPKG